jgi:hypothetical protein
MFTGTSISNSARDALFQTACDCVKYEKHERKVYHDDVEGIVYTRFDFGMLGDSIDGIVFEGDISTEEGETHTKFIVRLHELEKVRYTEGEWFSMDEFLEKMREKMEAKSKYKWN